MDRGELFHGRREGAEAVRAAVDTVLGKMALGNQDPAASARAAAAANGIQIDAEPAGAFQDRRADLETPAAARGDERHISVAGAHRAAAKGKSGRYGACASGGG